MSAELVDIAFRRALPADEGTIRRWLVAPHVARRTYRLLSGIIDTLDEALRTQEIVLYVAELDDRPIGLAHVYRAFGDPRWKGVPDVTEQTRSIDFFIGETDVINKKVGQRMLNALAARVFQDPDIDRIVVCPHADNWPAIIALKRAGFREKGRHPDAALNAMYLTVTPATLKR